MSRPASASGLQTPVMRGVDKLGAVLALLAAWGALALPFATLHANRIALGDPRLLINALPQAGAAGLLAVLAAAAAIGFTRSGAGVRLAAGTAALLALAIAIGVAARFLTPPDNEYARVAPASGFWLLGLTFALLLADAFTRLRLRPLGRVLALLAAIAATALLLASGIWRDLSVLREYAGRADRFWSLGAQHLALALGSMAVAVAAGVPVGIACQRSRRLRAPILGLLNVIQTIPSIALFGLLIAPLGWVALHLPGARALGISGIGAAPAFVALVGYSLLPVVANTVLGLEQVPTATLDAARGMGMTGRQRLVGVELPLAFPVILAAIRIVLVQNIGLATVAALIGGGGFGVFVFQGLGQMAMDLVLLGAIPTVALAFVAAVLLDAAVEATSRAAP